MVDLLKGVGLCVVLGMFIFAIAVFRGTRAQGDSLETAATGSAVVAAIVTSIAIGCCVVLWLKERHEAEGPSEGP